MSKNFLFSFFLTILIISSSFGQNSNAVVNANRPAVPKAVKTPAPDSDEEVKDAGPVSEVQAANSTIRGRVYYEDTGRAVRRASLMLVGANMRLGGGPGEYSALTDGNGEFVITNIRAGAYYAIVNAPGVVSPMAYLDFASLMDGPPDEKALGEATLIFSKIAVDGVNEQFVQIPAKRGAAISGRVIYENGDPAIGVRVEILRKVNGKFVSVIPNLSSIVGMFMGLGQGGGLTDDRGMYRFAGLPAGEYIVKVSESAKHSDNSAGQGGPDVMASLLFGTSSFLNFYFPGATDLKDAQILSVLLGQEQGEINITIPDNSLFHLSGKVIALKDKKPLAGAKISLEKKGDNVVSIFSEIGRRMNTSVTDEEGNWKFKELPKGEYTVTVEPPNNSGDADRPYAANSVSNVPGRPKAPTPPKLAKAFKDFKVEDKNLDDLIIELGFGAVISGTVTTENNKAMPSMVSIRATGERDQQLASTSIWNSGGEGTENDPRLPKNINNEFKLDSIAAGKVNLRFSVNNDDYYVKSAKSGMVDLMTSPLELKEGEILSNIKVILADDAGTLKGVVIDDKDLPASGVKILLVPTDAKKRSPNFFESAQSDIEGKFTVKLAPGEYAVLIVRSGGDETDKAAFDKWLEESMRSPEKVSIDPDKVSTIKLKKPAN